MGSSPYEQDPERFDRFLGLMKIFHETRHGVVDGIEIDIRDDRLDPARWNAGTLWTEEYAASWEPGPCLIFPWMVEPERTDLDIHPEFDPVHVRSGDRISVDDVVIRRIGQGWDHPRDVAEIDMYLCVTNSAGVARKLEKPVVFRDRLTVNGPRFWGEASFDKLAARLSFDMDIESIHAFDITEEGGLTAREFALVRAQDASREYVDLRKRIAPDGEGSTLNQTIYNLKRLVDAAVEFGYYVAVAEKEDSMLRYAQKGAKAELAPFLGGAATGEKALRNTHALYRQLAQHLQPLIDAKGEQALSRDDVARLAIDNWPVNGFDGDGRWRPQRVPYTHGTLTRTILPALEEEGLLRRNKPPSGRKGALQE